MHTFQNISIKRKLMLVVLLTAGAALFLSSMALVKYEMNAFHRSLKEGLMVQAKIIGNNSAAPLIFKDQKSAEETLSALRAAPNITNAVIYSKDGTAFAKYQRQDMKGDFLVPPLERDTIYFRFDHFNLFHTITFDGKDIGTLYIRSDVKELYSRLTGYTIAILIIMILSLSLAFLMSSKLQKTITVPILDLLQVMNAVSKDKNYSLRVFIHGRDELGSLAEGFNNMLSQIQERDLELELHREHLEKMVALRTDELEKINKKLKRELAIRQLAEESLAVEKEQLAVTLRSITDGVITTDTDGRIILMNKVAEDLTGWTLGEVAGKSVSDVFHIIDEKDRKRRCDDAVKKMIETGGTAAFSDYCILIDRDSKERIIMSSGALIRDKDSEIIGVVIVFQDISIRRKMEEDILRAQKLESIGVLAGGIAHDFNNLLTAILGNISLARMLVSTDDKISQRLTAAENASLRARDLTQQLLTFAKGGLPVKKVTSIKELIKDSAGFALSGSNVTYTVTIPDDLWAAEIDEGQISQVVQNLVINAEQAMPHGGSINVNCENITVDEEDLLPIPKGRYVQVSITDRGEGISPKYLQSIFDPYFSTKEKGRGLGLATVYSIIRNHDGYITVESQLGIGTTFMIYLPASEATIADRKTEDEKVLAAKGRILVMDDEEIVREILREMLNHAGYKVESAKDGTEAIEKYTEAMTTAEPFDAVIMDLTIPGGIGGKEAIKKLIEIDPNVKAVVSSGYSNDPIMSDFRRHGFSGAVSKPYKVTELIDTLSDMTAKNPKIKERGAFQ